MSLFLAAAAGFLSGKAERAKEKREEERVIREEEREIERQKRLYEFKYDYEARAKQNDRATEMAKQVVTLLRISGGQISEEAAVNMVSSGMFDAIRDAAAKGELNYTRAEAVFGGDEDVTEVDVDSLMAPSGIFITKEDKSGDPADFNTFAKSMQGTISSLFPEGIITFKTTSTGEVFPFFQVTANAQGTKISTMYENLLTRSFELYDTLYPAMGPRAALVTVKDYLLKSPFDVNNEDSFNALVDGLSVAALRRLAPVYIPPAAPEQPPPRRFRPAPAPAVTDIEQTGAAGVIPVEENLRGRNRNRYGENTDVTTTQPNTQWGPNVNFGQ